jgi:hypothetical protein
MEKIQQKRTIFFKKSQKNYRRNSPIFILIACFRDLKFPGGLDLGSKFRIFSYN